MREKGLEGSVVRRVGVDPGTVGKTPASDPREDRQIRPERLDVGPVKRAGQLGPRATPEVHDPSGAESARRLQGRSVHPSTPRSVRIRIHVQPIRRPLAGPGPKVRPRAGSGEPRTYSDRARYRHEDAPRRSHSPNHRHGAYYRAEAVSYRATRILKMRARAYPNAPRHARAPPFSPASCNLLVGLSSGRQGGGRRGRLSTTAYRRLITAPGSDSATPALRGLGSDWRSGVLWRPGS
jgi:hypothetical protein